MLAFQLQSLLHQFDDNRRAAHGQSPAQRQRTLPAHLPILRQQPSQQQGPSRCDHHRDAHLEQAKTKNMLAHRAQLGQIEFQPNHKHQENHTEFRQIPDRIGVLRQGQSIRPNDHANGQIPEHGGQLEHATNHHAQHRSEQIKQGQLKGVHDPILANDMPSRDDGGLSI